MCIDHMILLHFDPHYQLATKNTFVLFTCLLILPFSVFHSGIISFFFFSGRAKGVDIAPNLHYYWVPILVRE